MSGSWIKETFEKGMDEIQKLARTGSIKIDIANLKKKRDERVKLIGNKILEKIRKEEMKADEFEPDYSYILDLDKRIAAKEAELVNKDVNAPADTKTTPAESRHEQTTAQPQTAVQTPSGDDDRDPHEDYINRPG